MRGEVHDSVLSKAIEAKIDKHYTHTYPGRLSLLAYGEASLMAGANSAVTYAREHLAQRSHPFDEVWFITPYPGLMSGRIERISPGTSADHRRGFCTLAPLSSAVPGWTRRRPGRK